MWLKLHFFTRKNSLLARWKVSLMRKRIRIIQLYCEWWCRCAGYRERFHKGLIRVVDFFCGWIGMKRVLSDGCSELVEGTKRSLAHRKVISHYPEVSWWTNGCQYVAGQSNYSLKISLYRSWSGPKWRKGSRIDPLELMIYGSKTQMLPRSIQLLSLWLSTRTQSNEGSKVKQRSV